MLVICLMTLTSSFILGHISPIFFLSILGIEVCGPHILAHVLPLDGELDFYFENDLFIKKMTWICHLFLFYF